MKIPLKAILPLYIVAICFMGCKKDSVNPTPSTVGSSCQISSMTIGTLANGSSTGTILFRYGYTLSTPQLYSVTFNYAGNPKIIDTLIYAQGILSLVSGTGNNLIDNLQSYQQNSNTPITENYKFNSNGELTGIDYFQNGNLNTLARETSYSYGTNYIQVSSYNYSSSSVDVLTQYTISGLNISQSLETDYDVSGKVVLGTKYVTFGAYDSYFSGNYILYKSIPGILGVTSGIQSLNNPLSSTEINTQYDFTTGSVTSINTSATLYSYTYTNNGTVKQAVATTYAQGVSPTIVVTNFDYTNCN